MEAVGRRVRTMLPYMCLYRKGVNTVRILIPSSKLNSQEQLEMAKYLVKAGYAVSITKGKIQNGKSVTYINYNIAEVQDEQT